MARDVHVRGAHLRPRREVGQRQRHLDVARHELQYPLVEAAHCMAKQSAEMGLPVGHQLMVRQTDQKMPLLRRTRLPQCCSFIQPVLKSRLRTTLNCLNSKEISVDAPV